MITVVNDRYVCLEYDDGPFMVCRMLLSDGARGVVMKEVVVGLN